MSSINAVGLGIGALSTLFSAKKPATAATTATPFGDLLSKQGFAIASPSSTTTTKLSPADSSATSSATDEFQKYMQMSPAEKIRYNMLQQMGLTEDSLKALPPQQQGQIEAEIANRIKEQLGANATASVNGSSPNVQGPAGLFQSIQALQSTQSNNSTRSAVDTYS